MSSKHGERKAEMKANLHSMNRSWVVRVALIVMFVCASFLMGCSVFGYAVGNSIDQSNSYEARRANLALSKLDRWDVHKMTPGATARLSLQDGSVVKGEFVELTKLSEESYRIAYDKVRAELDPRYTLPASGATVTVEEMNGKRHRVRFFGVGLDTTTEQMPSGLALDARMQDLQGLILLDADSGTRVALRLSKIKGIFGEDGSLLLDGLVLRGLVLDGSVPLYTAVMLRVDDRMVPIGLDRIDSMALTGSEGHTKVAGVLTFVGILIDTALTVVTFELLKQSFDFDLSGSLPHGS